MVAGRTLYLESGHWGWRPYFALSAVWPWAGRFAETQFSSLFFRPPIPNLLGDPQKSFVSETFLMANYSTSTRHCYVVIALFFLT